MQGVFLPAIVLHHTTLHYITLLPLSTLLSGLTCNVKKKMLKLCIYSWSWMYNGSIQVNYLAQGYNSCVLDGNQTCNLSLTPPLDDAATCQPVCNAIWSYCHKDICFLQAIPMRQRIHQCGNFILCGTHLLCWTVPFKAKGMWQVKIPKCIVPLSAIQFGIKESMQQETGTRRRDTEYTSCMHVVHVQHAVPCRHTDREPRAELDSWRSWLLCGGRLALTLRDCWNTGKRVSNKNTFLFLQSYQEVLWPRIVKTAYINFQTSHASPL